MSKTGFQSALAEAEKDMTVVMGAGKRWKERELRELVKEAYDLGWKHAKQTDREMLFTDNPILAEILEIEVTK